MCFECSKYRPVDKNSNKISTGHFKPRRDEGVEMIGQTNWYYFYT